MPTFSNVQHRRYSQYPCNTMPKMLKDMPHTTSKTIKVINNNRRKPDTNSTKPATRKYHHLHAHNQPGKHLFYQHYLLQPDNTSEKKCIPGPPPCSNSQYHYKQYISGLHRAINNKQHLPLLPSPPHQHTTQGRQRPIITGPHPYT